MANEIRVPTLGESVAEATVGQWLKKAGEAVQADEPIVELETDKVSVEVPAPAAGVLADISVKEGETVEVGALLGIIDAAATAAAAPAKAETPAKASSGKVVDVPVPSAGESVTEAGVGEWLKKLGESVKADEPLVELETDKAAQEVMAPVSGKLVEIVAQSGETVEVGAILARIEEGAAGDAAAPSMPASTPDVNTSQKSTSAMPPAPSAQKMMAENGCPNLT